MVLVRTRSARGAAHAGIAVRTRSARGAAHTGSAVLLYVNLNHTDPIVNLDHLQFLITGAGAGHAADLF